MACPARRIVVYIVIATLLVVARGTALNTAEAASRPNIVVILMDDLRWDALGCTGHPLVRTPNIDRIAKEGAIFRNAFVTTPICLPSRACFLTGQYAHRHGVTGSGDHLTLGRKLPTFPRLLQGAGYETAYVGKWHIGNEDGPRPGFDRWVSFLGQGAYVDPQLNIDGERMHVEGYLTDILTDHAVEFIQRPRSQPFMLYLAHKAVHAPFVPAERHKNLFTDVPIVRSAGAKDNLEGKPVLRRPGVTFAKNDPDVSTSDDDIRNQLRCLMAVEEGVGKILDALTETKQLDETMLVFTSDHGYFWGEHGLGGKHGPYEEAIRIPLLMRYPKLIKPGTTFDPLVLNIDLAPTLLELASLTPPQTMQGCSLVPLLSGMTSGWRPSVLLEYFYNRGQTPRFPTWQAVRTERWKYIHYPNFTEMDELYDLHADSAEIHNVLDRPAASKTVKELQQELARLLMETK